MWPHLFKLHKEAGLHAIDTMFFWSAHEKIRGTFDFEGRHNIRQFIKLAHEAGLYVILRIGPYVLFM